MKFKFKPESGNLILMSLIIILSLVTCIVWLILREYVYFLVYLLLTLVIAYMYYFTSYYIQEDYFILQLGFIKIKYKYSMIKKIKVLKNKVKLKLSWYSLDIYPSNLELFVSQLNAKIDKQKFV